MSELEDDVCDCDMPGGVCVKTQETERLCDRILSLMED